MRNLLGPPSRTFERHTLAIDTHVVDTAAELDGCSRLRGCRMQLLIEAEAIDGDGLDPFTRVGDRLP